jgi:peptide/nickel transport system substrate-binding protein
VIPGQRPGTRGGSALAAALCLLVGWACRGPEREPVRIACESPLPRTLDPDPAFVDGAVHSVFCNFYDSLTAFDRNMRIGPGLAVSWNSPDDTTWVFELRKDVVFHDGSPLTAEEVRSSLERSRSSPDPAVARHLAVIAGIEVVNAHVLRIRTHKTDALLAGRLAEALIARRDQAAGAAPHFVGTGAYVAEGWENGVLRSRAFPRYWRGRPPIPEVSFVGNARVPDVARLNIDVFRFTGTLPPEQDPPGRRVIYRPSTAGTYLWYDTRAGDKANPLSDRRVRQAVSLALDRKTLAQTYGGRSQPLTQLVPAGIYGHLEDLPELAFDRARARDLLRQAGYPKGLDLGPLEYPGNRGVEELAKAIQQELASIGVTVEARPIEWPTLLSQWPEGKVRLFVATWFLEDGDATTFLTDCIESRDREHNRGAYNPGYEDPEMDSLIEEQAGILQDAERLEHYRRLMARAMTELPIVPLISPGVSYGLSGRIQWEPRLDGKMLAAEMTASP